MHPAVDTLHFVYPPQTKTQTAQAGKYVRALSAAQITTHYTDTLVFTRLHHIGINKLDSAGRQAGLVVGKLVFFTN